MAPTTRAAKAAASAGEAMPQSSSDLTAAGLQAADSRSRASRSKRGTSNSKNAPVVPKPEARSAVLKLSIARSKKKTITFGATSKLSKATSPKATLLPAKAPVTPKASRASTNRRGTITPHLSGKIAGTPASESQADDDTVMQDVTTSGPGADYQPRQESKFLKLPGEIRNSIYEMVLLSDTPLNINGDEPKQPAITRTCRQIREETIRTFYSRNSFQCVITDYDPSSFKQYRKVADKHGLSTVVLTHRHTFGCDRKVLRENLLTWLKGTFEGETAPLGYSSGHSDDTFNWEKLSHRIVKVFNVAKEMRKMKVKWDVAKAVLENAVDAAGVCGEKKK